MKPSYALVLAAILAAPVCLADDEKMSPEAVVRFNEGRALSARGQYEEARVKYLQVLALGSYANAYLNAAIAEEATGRPLDAIKHLRAFLSHPRAEPAKVDQARRGLLTLLSARTAHLRVTAPVGAKVSIDGERVGTAPITEIIDVMPGKHRITIVGGGEPTDVVLELGETKEIDLAPPADPPSPAPVKSGLGDAPPPVGAPRLSSGAWSGPSTSASLPAATVSWPPPTVSIVLGAAGIAALAVGAGFAVDAGNKSNELGSDASRGVCAISTSAACQARQDTIDAETRSRTIAQVTLAAGGAAIVLGGIYWALKPRHVPRTALAPWVGPKGAGVAWDLAF